MWCLPYGTDFHIKTFTTAHRLGLCLPRLMVRLPVAVSGTNDIIYLQTATANPVRPQHTGDRIMSIPRLPFFCSSLLSKLTLLIVCTLLSQSAQARIRLYSRAKADSLRVQDSIKRADTRYIADSTLKASYLKSAKKKKFHLYSREQTEQQTIDSVKILDSIRVADSTRIADSIVIARYQNAEVKITGEREAAKAAAAAPEPVVEPIRSTTPAYSDNLSARTITIAPDNPYAREIDSLQARIDFVNDSLHDNDRYFKKMKVFPTSEKQRYISYLLENNRKDSSQVLSYLTTLFDLYKIKQNLLIAIRNAQDANTKSFISYHLEVHLQKMGELSELLLAYTPTVPFQPEHRAKAENVQK